MAGAQDLVLQPPRPMLRRDAPCHFTALLGASVVALSVAGERPVHAGCALAGLLLWLVGVARLLLQLRQAGQHPLFPGALAAAAACLARAASHHQLLMLLGGSVVVASVVGEPPIHAGYPLAGFLLWTLGAARLLFPGALAAAAAAANVTTEKLKHFVFRRQGPASAPA
ncbi:hypothetical protein ACP70R_039502 [Stipagrostis hirtigluma subsp. patula]